MAKWRAERDWPSVPERVLRYDPEVHGHGYAAIRTWKAEALSWLDKHPGQVLPAGDELGVLRCAIRLIAADAGFPE